MGDEKLLREMGARINYVRKGLKITQEQLAEKMDVSVQMISNLELGKKAIRPENLVKLCSELGVSADYLLRGVSADGWSREFVDKFKLLQVEKQELILRLIEAML